MRLAYPDSVQGYRVSDLAPLPAWPLRVDGSFENTRANLIVFTPSSQPHVWVTDTPSLSAPPEHQQLLTELWTGYRLQSGVPVEMYPEEMAERYRKWQKLGGGNWNTVPNSLPQPVPDLTIPLSLGAIGLLLIFCYLNKESPR